jgi:hypothetical protein
MEPTNILCIAHFLCSLFALLDIVLHFLWIVSFHLKAWICGILVLYSLEFWVFGSLLSLTLSLLNPLSVPVSWLLG